MKRYHESLQLVQTQRGIPLKIFILFLLFGGLGALRVEASGQDSLSVERGDNHQLAELDVRTGAFQTYTFPGYNSSTYVTTVYKDYLFYGTLNYYFYVGAIDLRTHEMLPEVKIDYTPGDFNQIASIGVHEGQLYVEIQTELDHSDIHVLDLDEDN